MTAINGAHLAELDTASRLAEYQRATPVSQESLRQACITCASDYSRPEDVSAAGEALYLAVTDLLKE